MFVSKMALKYDTQTDHILEKYFTVIDATTRLFQKDLPFVMGAMTRVKARWRNIGLQWGIDNATLADIDTENHTNDSRFIAMIVEWLSNPNPNEPPPTWREVIIAVARSTAGDDADEAMKLAQLCATEGGKCSLSYIPEAEGVDDSVLTSKVMKEVVAELVPVSTKWKEIGIMFGLPYHYLHMLSSSGKKTADCVFDMIEKWLKKNYDTANFGMPSWKKLVEVVGARVGGNDSSVASEIASRHQAEPMEEEVKGTKRPHSGQQEEVDGGEKKPHLEELGSSMQEDRMAGISDKANERPPNAVIGNSKVPRSEGAPSFEGSSPSPANVSKTTNSERGAEVANGDTSTQEADKTLVKKGNIQSLMKHLRQCASKWKDVGYSLNFQGWEMDSIRDTFPRATPQELMRELMEKWCEWPNDDHPNRPTLEKLCGALRSGTVGYGALANTIEGERDTLLS